MIPMKSGDDRSALRRGDVAARQRQPVLVEFLCHVDGAGELIAPQQRAQTRLAARDPDIGAEAAESAERQTLLIRVELPGMKIEHGHRRRAAMVRLTQRPPREEQWE